MTPAVRKSALSRLKNIRANFTRVIEGPFKNFFELASKDPTEDFFQAWDAGLEKLSQQLHSGEIAKAMDDVIACLEAQAAASKASAPLVDSEGVQTSPSASGEATEALAASE